MESKIFLFGILLLTSFCSPSYQQRNRVRLQAGSTSNLPQPDPQRRYRFAYDIKDYFGGSNYHEAQSDKTGKIKGKYGYTHIDGVFRRVEYEADANGYHATILTNEPGIGKKNPADVTFVVEPVPQALIRKYNDQAPSAGRTRSSTQPPARIYPKAGYGPPVKPA